MSAELVPVARPLPARPDADSMHNLVTDVSCTRCTRRVTNITLFELAWAKPCPLCRTCAECRDLCASGAVLHGLEGQR